MGQQQLLLLVLGVVLVGLAVVLGLQAFGENQRKSEVDTYTTMGVQMAGEIIAYHMKPAATGGAGQDPARLGELTIADLGYRGDVEDTWAGYDRSGTVANGVVRYVAASETHPFLHIHPYPIAGGQTRVEVHVFGPSEDCVVARNDVRGVSPTWSDGKGNGEAPDNPDPAVCSW
ncbi:hypothetical protein [Rubrivirga marina]|uniref:Uncharacterized protein n=1 Tax=Rubrivirga marina TaxID=1196024 RepID=A0A271J2N0_9BACT|nr:hypothetical protein [Rubrivirga marina]PAP77225.1 hypothetical protein BSZ37_12670 [Rubrivirga marina]